MANKNQKNQLSTLFDKYKDAPDNILVDGTVNLCKDLGVDVQDKILLSLAYYTNAKMCDFNRKDFIEGLAKLYVFSLDELKKIIPNLRGRLDDLTDKDFPKIYQFIFDFGKASAEQRNLGVDLAIGFWQLFFGNGVLEKFNKEFIYLEQWFSYLKEEEKVKVISRDTWDLFLDFAKTSKKDFTNFDSNSAWPTLIDGFVEYIKESKE